MKLFPIGLVDGECGNLPYFGIMPYLKNDALLGKMKHYDRWLISFADGHIKVY